MSFLSCGRSAVEPVTFSLNTRSHPAAFKPLSWAVRSWASVETRAYPKIMLNYATDICSKDALKNQRRDFVSNVLQTVWKAGLTEFHCRLSRVRGFASRALKGAASGFGSPRLGGCPPGVHKVFAPAIPTLAAIPGRMGEGIEGRGSGVPREYCV